MCSIPCGATRLREAGAIVVLEPPEQQATLLLSIEFKKFVYGYTR